jgi:L-asparaginase
MKKLLMLTTGGTISSVESESGLVPSSADTILKQMGIEQTHEFSLDVKEILLLDSSNIQPEEWNIIATAIYENMHNYGGIIVTHGTDTMAYSTSMVSFMVQNPSIPVVFTGSQLPIGNFLTDAITNLRSAFAMALSGVPGIFVAFDRKIILGTRAVKVRTTSFNAFESINLKYAGTVDSNGLSLNHYVIPTYNDKTIFNNKINSDVFLLKLTPATNPNIIDLLINSKVSGIVIEAFGAGGIQFVRRDFIEKLHNASKHNIPVVVCSQCLYESSNFNIYQVGKKALSAGVIEAFDMTTESAVTKLMWALGQTSNISEIKKIFETNYAGEIRFDK